MVGSPADKRIMHDSLPKSLKLHDSVMVIIGIVTLAIFLILILVIIT